VQFCFIKKGKMMKNTLVFFLINAAASEEKSYYN
jgi:hypothetical protein